MNTKYVYYISESLLSFIASADALRFLPFSVRGHITKLQIWTVRAFSSSSIDAACKQFPTFRMIAYIPQQCDQFTSMIERMARFKICFASSAMATAINPSFPKWKWQDEAATITHIFCDLPLTTWPHIGMYVAWEAFGLRHNMPRQAKQWPHASMCATQLKQSSSRQHDMIAALLCFMLRPEPGNLMVDVLHAHVRSWRMTW